QLLQELGRHFPAALTVGHRDLNPQKACPSFDAAKEYKKDAPRGRP
ncbi:N-acetylmuramoyl-L-alanine amidase, partial [Parabacteroides merdae]|nr:N-acetylmuramoyl-L-alanine amidase [Parabacteroides merdae]